MKTTRKNFSEKRSESTLSTRVEAPYGKDITCLSIVYSGNKRLNKNKIKTCTRKKQTDTCPSMWEKKRKKRRKPCQSKRSDTWCDLRCPSPRMALFFSRGFKGRTLKRQY